MKNRYRKFESARKYVRKLKLRNVSEYWKWCKGVISKLPSKPQDIPSNPHQVYKVEWVSFSDFLGTNRTAFFNRTFLPFCEAREFASALGLHSYKEWQEYACGRHKVPGMPPRPANIPSNPNFTYKGKGWAGAADWLGYGGPILPFPSKFRPFDEARAFARELKLSGWLQWREFVQGKLAVKLPPDIPAVPHAAYKTEGWVDYGDWLGTGLKAYHQCPFLSFEDAVRFVAKLGLRNQHEWRAYCRGDIAELEAKPVCIPVNPDKVYRSEWKGWDVWFGKSA